MEEFIEKLLNGMPLGELAAYMVFAMIGASLSVVYKIRNRFKSDNGKPDEWSYRFFIIDNSFRLVMTPAIVFLWARFSQELVSWVPENLYAVGLFMYVIIGLATDHIIRWFSNKMSSFEVKV